MIEYNEQYYSPNALRSCQLYEQDMATLQQIVELDKAIKAVS